MSTLAPLPSLVRLCFFLFFMWFCTLSRLQRTQWMLSIRSKQHIYSLIVAIFRTKSACSKYEKMKSRCGFVRWFGQRAKDLAFHSPLCDFCLWSACKLLYFNLLLLRCNRKPQAFLIRSKCSLLGPQTDWQTAKRLKVKVKVHNNRPRGHALCAVYWKYISEKVSQRT